MPYLYLSSNVTSANKKIKQMFQGDRGEAGDPGPAGFPGHKVVYLSILNFVGVYFTDRHSFTCDLAKPCDPV